MSQNTTGFNNMGANMGVPMNTGGYMQFGASRDVNNQNMTAPYLQSNIINSTPLFDPSVFANNFGSSIG